MSLNLTPPPCPHMPPPAFSAAAEIAVSALRTIRAVTFDRRAADIARRALCKLGECEP